MVKHVLVENLGTEFELSAPDINIKLASGELTKNASGEIGLALGAIAAATTNNLTVSGATLTSVVNGVLSSVPLSAIAPPPAPTTSTASVSGSSLTTTINGVTTTTDLSALVQAAETATTLVYDAVTKTLSYTNEVGSIATIDLSALAVDVNLSSGAYDPATLVLTLTDSDGSLVSVNLSDLKKTSTTDSATISFTGTGETSAPLSANITAVPANLITGVLPASATPPTTVSSTLSPTGLVVTVNGVSSTPIAIPDDQTLNLSGTTLGIESGNTVDFSTLPVTMSQLQPGTLPPGVTVSPSSLPPTTVVGSVTDTPTGSTLVLTVNGVASAPITIPDNQAIELTGAQLSIENGNTVNLGTMPIAVSQLQSGTLPSGVTVSPASLPPTTVVGSVTDTPTGSTLVVTVDGVASAPIAIPDNQTIALTGTQLSIENGNTVNLGTMPITMSQLQPGTLPSGVTVSPASLPATTVANTWTKTTGLNESVNSVSSSIAIPSGAIADVVGYGSGGTPVYQSLGTLPIAPSQLTAGSLPANISISPSSLPPTTVSNAIVGDQLTTTVNGVAANPVTVPGANLTWSDAIHGVIDQTTGSTAIAPIYVGTSIPGLVPSAPSSPTGKFLQADGTWQTVSVPATTHVNTWTQAGGLAENVNGVTSNVSIPAGTVTNVLGYNAAGSPVYQPLPIVPVLIGTSVTTATSVSLTSTTSTVGNVVTTVIQTLVIVTAAGTVITLPAPSDVPISVEIDVKTIGTWSGGTTVASAGGATVDGAASLVFTKSAGTNSSRSFRTNGISWFVV
jgi:trimeric autotransporter adhesin